MDSDNEKSAQELFDRQIISQDELIAIKAYRSLGIFSLHHELLMLLYIAVLLISGGLGILIYQNIDTIGHSAVIAFVFIAAVACFYLSLRKAPKFSFEETFFENPVFDYTVLLGTLLTGVFFGYLQFQYSPFGNSFALAALFSSIAAFVAAYRFDNRSSLSIGITALAATLGITLTPKAVLELDVFENQPLFSTGVALGIALVIWAEYARRTRLKKHFSAVFFGFAQHLIGICCIAGACSDLWPIFVLVMVGTTYFFFAKSRENASVATFAFAILYAYIVFNIGLVRLLLFANSEELMIACAYLAPIFYCASIVLFILQVQKFKKKSNDSL